MAEMRVASRVASGGHNIPQDVIHRRYWAGLQNLFEIFVPIIDLWSLYDNNSETQPIVKNGIIVDEEKLHNQRIMSEEDKIDFSDKITEGIRKAQRKLFERTGRKNRKANPACLAGFAF